MQEFALFCGKIYTADTNFTRLPVVTVATNLNSGIGKIHFLRLSPTNSVGGPVVQVHPTLILGYFVWFCWLVWGLDTIPNLGIGQCPLQYATQITSLQNSKSKCIIHPGRFDTILAA